MSRGATSIVAVLAAVGAACSTPLGFEREIDAPIQTGRLGYRLLRDGVGVSTEIHYVYTNRTDRPIYVVNCGGSTGVVLEKLVDGEWVHAWGNTVPDCLSPPIVIPTGESTARTLGVFGGDPGCRCAPQFAFEHREGIYRMVLVDVLDSFDADASPFGQTIPIEARVSNRFRLEE